MITGIFSIFLLCSCSASLQTQTDYYQFEQPITSASRHVDTTVAQLRVQNVVMRGALNNRGIAMKIQSNQVHNANYNMWSEAPDVMLAASAQQTLFSALPQWMVVKGLPVITELDQQTFYEIEYELHHFNGDLQGNADIAGLWRLYFTDPQTGRRLVSIHNFTKLIKITDDGYEALVSGLEKAWVEVNNDVAAVIKKQNIHIKN